MIRMNNDYSYNIIHIFASLKQTKLLSAMKYINNRHHHTHFNYKQQKDDN